MPSSGSKGRSAYGQRRTTPTRPHAVRLLTQLEPVHPGISRLWTGAATSPQPHLDPNLRLAYSYFRVGQYHRIAGYEGVRQGSVFFAGEHTSLDFQGYMEGAAAEGIRAGRQTPQPWDGRPERRREGPRMRIVALSGGVGGARFLPARPATDPAGITVIGNVGDDVEVLGMHVSPDLDSILYALAGVADDGAWLGCGPTRPGSPSRRRRPRGRVLVHARRPRPRPSPRAHAGARAGEPLSAVTARLAAAFGVGAAIVPATDDRLRTRIDTPAGAFPFQEWFVARRHRTTSTASRSTARMQPPRARLVEAIEPADLIVVCPSNPFISIWPILAVEADPRRSRAPPRSPPSPSARSMGGQAIKGPADRMLSRLAGGTDPGRVATCSPGWSTSSSSTSRTRTVPAAVERAGIRPVDGRRP